MVLLLLFSLVLVSQRLRRWLETPWFRQAAVEAPVADAIFVLSGGHHPAFGAARLNEFHDNDNDLLQAGLDLYRASKAPKLLFTGGASAPSALVSRRKASATCMKRGSLGFLLQQWLARHL